MGQRCQRLGTTAHGSDVTLKSLMEPIACYRGDFYHDQIERLPTAHRERLQAEIRQRRQPFGAARQHLNAALALARAKQLQHVQLARIYARMGYPDSAKKPSRQSARDLGATDVPYRLPHVRWTACAAKW